MVQDRAAMNGFPFEPGDLVRSRILLASNLARHQPGTVLMFCKHYCTPDGVHKFIMWHGPTQATFVLGRDRDPNEVADQWFERVSP